MLWCYGLSAGETEFQVAEFLGDAVVADSMEFTVDQAGAGLTTGEGKHNVLLALDMLRNHVANSSKISVSGQFSYPMHNCRR